MKSGSSFNKRASKAVVASTLGIALLLGGSTYALWSVNAEMGSSATIAAGDLQVSAASAQNWFDVTDEARPLELSSLNNFLLAPGDKLQLTQDLNVIVVGDNISGVLKLLVPNSSESSAILAQTTLTLSLFNKDGVEISSVTPDVNTRNSLMLDVGNLPQTTSEGSIYTAKTTLELPESSTNETKLKLNSLEAMAITLEQGPPYEEPAPSYPEANPATDFVWATNGDNVGTITNYIGTSKDVVIPESYIKDGVTYTVTTIGKNAFATKDLTSVVMPNSIVSLRRLLLHE